MIVFVDTEARPCTWTTPVVEQAKTASTIAQCFPAVAATRLMTAEPVSVSSKLPSARLENVESPVGLVLRFACHVPAPVTVGNVSPNA